MPQEPFDSIEEAVAAIEKSARKIVCDDESRENEGDFIYAAVKSTPEKVNFLAREGGGIICLPLTRERCDELDLEMMVSRNTARH